MERRKFVLSTGALAAGGSLALGTGAFSSVEAERDVAVSVVGDADAYLGIQPSDGPNGEYARTLDNGELAIDLTDSNDEVSGGGAGINTNAVTAIADVFRIRNQGTQPVNVALTPLAFANVKGQLFPPDVEGALAVLLVPRNPDEIGASLEIDMEVDWLGNVEVDASGFIGIKDLPVGESFEFSLAAIALPESAIGSNSISDELVITAEEV